MKLKCLAALLILSPIAMANPPAITKPTLKALAPPTLNINAPSWILLSYQSGQVIAGKNIHEHRPVASLTKLMTSYVASQAIESGKIKPNDPVHISVKAWRTGGSKSFIKEGSNVSVQTLLKGMVIQSGNDAAVSLAEHIAGSEQAFSQLMNHTATALEMKNTHFLNASGMPAPGQYSSAYDIAMLSRALIAHFPQEYRWYKQKSFSYNGIKQYNRNRLLWHDKQIDGLKTGYTEAAGYCLAASGETDGQRYIAVVLGASSIRTREHFAKQLLTYANRFYTTKRLFAKGDSISQVPINGAANQKLIATVNAPIFVTIPKNKVNAIGAHLALKTNLSLPIKAGSNIGKIVVKLGNTTLESRPAMAKNTVLKASLWERSTHWVKSLF